MRVAVASAVGSAPEEEAWNRLQAWAAPRGLLDDLEAHPVFGFNNPPPEPGKSEYGYEFWISVDDTTEAAGDVHFLDYPGGRFAVTTCKLQGDPRGKMPEIWQQLLEWVQASDYTWRPVHELEGIRNPGAPIEEVVLDLYLPIED
jgi:DNA gyrase inhibitor GyrI